MSETHHARMAARGRKTGKHSAEALALREALERISEAASVAAEAQWLVVGTNRQDPDLDFLPRQQTTYRGPHDEEWLRLATSRAEETSAFDVILFFEPEPLDNESSTEDSSEPAEAQLHRAATCLRKQGQLVWISNRQTEDVEAPVVLDRLAVLAQEIGLRLRKQISLIDKHEFDSGEPKILSVFQRDGFRLRSCQDDDIPEILELFERSFYHQRPEEHWRWKYQRNPWGNERITLIEHDPLFEGDAGAGQGIVGQYCAYPVPWIRFEPQSEPSRMLCHQVGDTMTAAHVRSVGRGPSSLLARAARDFYMRHCQGQVAFNYGFNTGNIRKFSKRFVGALDVVPAPYRVLELGRGLRTAAMAESGPPRLLQRFKRWLSNDPQAPAVRRVQQLDGRFDELLSQSLPLYRLLVERSSTYLSWRYLEAPDVEYLLYGAYDGEQLIGWGVFCQRGEELVWGDALFRDEMSAPSAANAILNHAVLEAPSTTRVVAWFHSPPDWWGRWLDEIGFLRRDEPNDLAMVVVPFEWPDPVPTLQQELYLTMGDSDLF